MSAAAGCTIRYYYATMAYTVFSKNRTVYHTVWYRSTGNCNNSIYVTQANDRLSANPSSGGIYWWYTTWEGAAAGVSWGMGCRALSSGGLNHYYSGSGWFGYSGYRWGDEVIDWSPCAGGTGNSYTSTVYI